MRRLNVKKLVNLSVFLALGVIFNILENYIVFIPFIPGVKLGLANTIGLILLAFYGPAEFIAIGFLRVIISGTFSGFGTSFFLAMSGFLVSSLFVVALYYTRQLSLFGLSLISAVTHGIAQVFVIALIYENLLMLNYMFIMILSGLITGILIAFLSRIVIMRLSPLVIGEKYCEPT